MRCIVVCFAATSPAIVSFPQIEGYTVLIRNLRTVLPLACRRLGICWYRPVAGEGQLDAERGFWQDVVYGPGCGSEWGHSAARCDASRGN